MYFVVNVSLSCSFNGSVFLPAPCPAADASHICLIFALLPAVYINASWVHNLITTFVRLIKDVWFSREESVQVHQLVRTSRKNENSQQNSGVTF